MIDAARQNSTERLEVTFQSSVGGVLTPITPDSCELALEYMGAFGLDSPSVVASGLTVNLGQPCYYDLTPILTANLGQYRAEWTAVIGTQTVMHTQYYEVVRNKSSYANEKDILENLKEMELPSGLDITRYLSKAESDMNIYLAEIYSMPIDVTAATITERDAKILEEIAADLASGRLIKGLGMSTGTLNEVADDLEKKAWQKLMDIRNGKIELESITKRSVVTRKDIPKVSYDHPDYIDNETDDTSFFGDTEKMGSQNTWRTLY